MSKIKSVKYSKKDISKLVFLPLKDANKYSRGISYIVAGSETYPGAAVLCSRAAERSGSGYTKLFTVATLKKDLAIMTPSIPAEAFDSISFSCSSKHPSAWLIGPGFVPYNFDNKDLLLKVLDNAKSTVIIDGGALTLLRDEKVSHAIFARSENNLDTIITPHKGEAETILESEISSKNLKNAALELSDLLKCICVLKGPDTVVCDNKHFYVMKNGTSALAKAGSGDVLAGILVGICCQQRVNAFEACVLATNIHAQSANIASKKLHPVSVNPSDIIDNIPASFSFFN